MIFGGDFNLFFDTSIQTLQKYNLKEEIFGETYRDKEVLMQYMES